MIRNKVQIIGDKERVIVRNTDTDKLLTSESVSICLRVSWLHKRHRWLTYHFLRLRLRDSQLHLLHRNRLPLERKKMKGIKKKVTKWKGIKVNGGGGGGREGVIWRAVQSNTTDLTILLGQSNLPEKPLHFIPTSWSWPINLRPTLVQNLS